MVSTAVRCDAAAGPKGRRRCKKNAKWHKVTRMHRPQPLCGPHKRAAEARALPGDQFVSLDIPITESRGVEEDTRAGVLEARTHGTEAVRTTLKPGSNSLPQKGPRLGDGNGGKRKPWRTVVHIASRPTRRNGILWRLTLECGHLLSKYAPNPPLYAVMFRPMKFAPKRVRCFVCEPERESP